MKKGYGFIASPQFPKDVFFLRGSLPPELAVGFYPELDFQLKGALVTFQVQLSETNGQQLQACAIRLVHVPGKPLVGQVKTWNASKGYGFLTCSALEGKDVLFLRKDVPPLSQGLDL